MEIVPQSCIGKCFWLYTIFDQYSL